MQACLQTISPEIAIDKTKRINIPELSHCISQYCSVFIRNTVMLKVFLGTAEHERFNISQDCETIKLQISFATEI